MSYGLQCFNNGGELTLASEAYTFSYLGKATFVSRTDYTSTALTSDQGDSIWTFPASGPIIVALGLKSSNQAGIVLSRIWTPSPGVWNIGVQDMSTALTGPSGTSIYHQLRTDSDVYVFGLPTLANLPPYGMAMFNSAGALTADLSKRILSPAARIAIPAGTSSATIPALTKPAIIGPTAYGNVTTAVDGTDGDGNPTYENKGYEGIWHWNGSTSLSRTLVQTSDARKQDPDTSGLTYLATTALIIEANGLT